MKRRDFREKNLPLVMIIPMIDIMLFLLVFFMLSTIYMVQTNTLPVSLPQSTAAGKETRPNVVPITVLASGDVLFVLRGDKAARYESVVAVLDLLKKSGARRVSIATELKGN